MGAGLLSLANQSGPVFEINNPIGFQWLYTVGTVWKEIPLKTRRKLCRPKKSAKKVGKYFFFKKYKYYPLTKTYPKEKF